MARPSTTPGGTPEFLTSEAAGGIVAAIIDLGTKAFAEQSAERGTSAIDEAARLAGVRAARQLREVHAGGES
jgi:hypothetical protein